MLFFEWRAPTDPGAEPPSHWDDMAGNLWKKVDLDEQSSEYKDVLRKFKKSNPTCSRIKKVI